MDGCYLAGRRQEGVTDALGVHTVALKPAVVRRLGRWVGAARRDAGRSWNIACPGVPPRATERSQRIRFDGQAALYLPRSK